MRLRREQEGSEHGTAEMYDEMGCRCRVCQRGHRALRIADPQDPLHGSPTGFSHYGCRCARCKKSRVQKAPRTQVPSVKEHLPHIEFSWIKVIPNSALPE